MEIFAKVVDYTDCVTVTTQRNGVSSQMQKREVVLQTLECRSGQGVNYAGPQQIVASLFGNDAANFNANKGCYVVASLSFSANKTIKDNITHYFQNIVMSRYAYPTQEQL